MRVAGYGFVSSFRFQVLVASFLFSVLGFLEWDNEMLDLHSVMGDYFGILQKLFFLATD